MEQRDTIAYSSTASLPSLERLGEYFPQLEILELVGQGGMGVVYRARQRKLNRMVALKILLPGKDASFAERFAREAQSLAALNHPGIIGIHDFGEAHGYYYLLMEFNDGVNLRQLLREKRLAPEEALQIVPQICSALQYAHDEGIAHRDIKPENILLDKKGRVKIADFGLAKLLGRQLDGAGLTGSQQIMGTLNYMAPEQMERPQSVDHRADIYSLGVVFYEMLTGELPLGRFAPPSQKAGVNVQLDEVVLRALEKEPDRRYQQVSELKEKVETVSTQSDRLHAKSPKPISLAFWQYVVGILAIIVAAVPSLCWTSPFWGIFGSSSSLGPEVSVGEVLVNSPAEKAGIRVRDVILSVENRALDGVFSLKSLFDSMSPGSELKLNIRRGDAPAKEILVIPVVGVEPAFAGLHYYLWQWLSVCVIVLLLIALFLIPENHRWCIWRAITSILIAFALIAVIVLEGNSLRWSVSVWNLWPTNGIPTFVNYCLQVVLMLLVFLFSILTVVELRTVSQRTNR